jgi:hypothetical protein
MDNVQNCDSYINIPSSQTCWAHVGDVMCFLWGTDKPTELSSNLQLASVVFLPVFKFNLEGRSWYPPKLQNLPSLRGVMTQNNRIIHGNYQGNLKSS